MPPSANFDAVAHTYDADFTNSVIGRLQRNQVWTFFTKRFAPISGHEVLEINCGTGEDAWWLSSIGYQVTATDLSPLMIDVASNRLHKNRQVTFHVAGFHQLATIIKNQTFDIIFSNFAGLNCIAANELQQLDKDLASLLRPKAKLVMVVLGKKCWMERLYFIILGKREQAFRRTHPTEAQLGNGSVQFTQVYSIHELQELFSSFTLVDYKPVGIVIPPSYLEGRLKRYGWAVPLMVAAEKVLSRFSFFSDYADHTFVVFEKK